MFKKFGFILAAAFIVLAGSCAAAMAQSFSADVVMKSGKEITNGKIFVSPQKMRMDMTEMTTITRMDLKIVWMIMHEEKMYMERAITPGTYVPSADKAEGEIERVFLAADMVDGKAADKYRITVSSNGEKHSYYQWMRSDSGFPVKMAALDNSWSQEYRNLVLEEPTAATFELPSGYRKMSMYGM